MSRLTAALVVAAVALGVAGDAGANGREVQREVVGRIVAVDAARGTLVVERELRGRRWTLAMSVKPGTTVFGCGEGRASVAELRAGEPVSVYYEPVGREGLANLVVIEPRD